MEFLDLKNAISKILFCFRGLTADWIKEKIITNIKTDEQRVFNLQNTKRKNDQKIVSVGILEIRCTTSKSFEGKENENLKKMMNLTNGKKTGEI